MLAAFSNSVGFNRWRLLNQFQQAPGLSVSVYTAGLGLWFTQPIPISTYPYSAFAPDLITKSRHTGKSRSMILAKSAPPPATGSNPRSINLF